MKDYKIFIGWDPREEVAYNVLQDSIASNIVYEGGILNEEDTLRIIPLKLNTPLLSVLKRPIEQKNGRLWCPISQAYMATEFSNSRFAIPFLTKGWALFMDCDMLVTTDICNLFTETEREENQKYAVMVVKHNHISGVETKMDNQSQDYYNRKNWSSVILWNCDHPSNKNLTEEMLNTLPGRDLHAFCWLKDEEIGSLNPTWNFLVGVQEPPTILPANIHYTLGTPNMPGYSNCQYAKEWFEAYESTYRYSFAPILTEDSLINKTESEK